MNERLVHAPRLDAESLPWFNVPRPLDLDDLAGKVVILDFWTYCCINCIHIIPTLKILEEKYPDDLVVIGVHSPKFPGEKITDNLERAIARYEIVHPVVHDTEFQIWNRYAVHAWPTLIFVGPDGYILGQLPGEPNPKLLEESFDHLIPEFKKNGTLTGGAQDLLQLSKTSKEGALSFPGKIAFSEKDQAFAIADSNHNQIVVADKQGNITHRIGSGDIGKQDGAFQEAQFYRPQGLCYDEGTIWVADTENHLLRKIDMNTQTVTTVAGTGVQGVWLKDKGKALEIALSSPWDVSIHDGWLYFANAGTHQIGVYYIAEEEVAQFAGTGQEALVDGPRLAAAFAQPSGLSIHDNKLYLADSETSAIRSVRLDEAGFTATYSGTGLFDFGDKDGVGKEAVYQHPLGVHCIEGALFIADSYNHKIKVMDLKSLEVMTVDASVEIVCDDKSCTRLWEPAGVLCVDNVLYVSDTNNHRILKINLGDGQTEIFIQ